MKNSVYPFLGVFALLLSGGRGEESFRIQDLDNEKWFAKKADYGYYFPTTVPGGVYSDLMNTKIIDDVFYGYNDNSTKWVGQINWTYSVEFEVRAVDPEADNVNLVLEGVDTMATVRLNNVTVGTTSNMFVRYVFDVKRLLKAGNNTVDVYFQSPVEAALSLYNKQTYRIPPECPPNEYRGECHVNMIRKMQASFSWDWGPSFPSMGLWKPVYLESYNETVIRYVVTRVQEKDEDNWSLNVDTYFADNVKKSVRGSLRVNITLDDDVEVAQVYPVNVKANDRGELVKSVSIEIAKNSVKLWWPNGYGAQPLYELTVDFLTGLDFSDVDTEKVKIGFRTVELVQDDLANGATFYFRVNGVPIFVKGSNEIPLNVLPERGQDRPTIRRALESARGAHMNMLRVWGGGVYESDYFYEVADELGIMIWQDFMFACSMYPADETFLNGVLDEVNHNVKRIYHHPSVVLYAGNNENEAALVDNWYGTGDSFERYKSDYVKLYVTTIRAEFDRITKSQGIFVSSSPSNGKRTEAEGWVSSQPQNALYGDVHFYNYVLNPWDSNTYPVPRFSSEYGYQSLPFAESWMTATNNTADLDIAGKFMDWRQHHPAGNGQMELLIAEVLPLPDRSHPNYAAAFIYLSEVLSSQAIKIETEHFRRYRSYLDDKGQGYTMGALYWQLNDVWVAPSWSSIDYTGRWKMLHYFARDMFSPVIVTGHLTVERQLQLYVVSDSLTTIENADVIVRVYKYNSTDFKPLYETTISRNVNESRSELIRTIATDDFLVEQNCGALQDAKKNCFFHFIVEKGSVAVSPQNYLFPGYLKDSFLPTPTVEISSVKLISDRSFAITVKSDNVALFVWLDSRSVRGGFSENGFLQVEAEKEIYFDSDAEITASELQGALTVTHLKDPVYWR